MTPAPMAPGPTSRNRRRIPSVIRGRLRRSVTPATRQAQPIQTSCTTPDRVTAAAIARPGSSPSRGAVSKAAISVRLKAMGAAAKGPKRSSAFRIPPSSATSEISVR